MAVVHAVYAAANTHEGDTMAKFTTDSRFLNHADISDVDDTVVTIKSYSNEIMGQGKDQTEKWTLFFKEIKKGLGLNKTNGKMCCKLFGTDDMDQWIGKQLAIYVKDDVEFQGDIVSAIRVRSKLPGLNGSAPEEDYSTLTVEEVVYRLDHAVSLKEIGGLITHGMTLPATPEQMKMMVDAKNSRVNTLMSQAKRHATTSNAPAAT
jgi:hypothetical protein